MKLYKITNKIWNEKVIDYVFADNIERAFIDYSNQMLTTLEQINLKKGDLKAKEICNSNDIINYD